MSYEGAAGLGDAGSVFGRRAPPASPPPALSWTSIAGILPVDDVDPPLGRAT